MEDAFRHRCQVWNEGQEPRPHSGRLRLERGGEHIQRTVRHHLADGAVQFGGRGLVVMGEFQGVEAHSAQHRHE
ncbi:MAG: hypothetical protein KGI32_04215 [Gammaproteobacteria bacterium]|nr:hypothetical protein [Gammaproteobacteria bacterium]